VKNTILINPYRPIIELHKTVDKQIKQMKTKTM